MPRRCRDSRADRRGLWPGECPAPLFVDPASRPPHPNSVEEPGPRPAAESVYRSRRAGRQVYSQGELRFESSLFTVTRRAATGSLRRRIPNKFAGFVDVALASLEPDWREAVLELAGAVVLRVDNKLAVPVDEAHAVSQAHLG